MPAFMPIGDWKNSSFDPAAGYWGDGVSDGNEGIRTIASMVLACATLLKYDDGLSDDERRELLDKATAAIRYVTATHITGPQKCTDGKHWGATEKFGAESWQSGMWTGTLAFGAWLMWDKLDPSVAERRPARGCLGGRHPGQKATAQRISGWTPRPRKTAGRCRAWSWGIDVSHPPARRLLARGRARLHDEHPLHGGRHAGHQPGGWTARK